MKRLLTSILSAALIALVVATPEANSLEPRECSFTTQSSTSQGVVGLQAQVTCTGSTGPVAEPPDTSIPIEPTVDTSIGTGVCVTAAIMLDEDISEMCEEEAVQGATPEVLTPAMILDAFRKLKVPPSNLFVQPPNGRTLINFDTNFFTDSRSLGRNITLLGRNIELRVQPALFHWKFGDGSRTETTTPGSRFPALDVTHEYRSTGTVSPSVNVTYTADFRVENGPWQEVPGTLTVAGASVSLEVVEAQPVLIGYAR